MRSWASSIGVLIVLAASQPGCGGSMEQRPAPAGAPAFRVDLAASEVRLANSLSADRVREIGAKALDAAVVQASGAPKPARFSAVVTADRGTAVSAPFAWILSPFAGILYIPTSELSTEVALTLEVGGKTYRGEGEDSAQFVIGGFDFFAEHDKEWEATVHNAFQEALADAIQKATAPRVAAGQRRVAAVRGAR